MGTAMKRNEFAWKSMFCSTLMCSCVCARVPCVYRTPKFADRLHFLVFVAWLISSHKHIDVVDAEDTNTGWHGHLVSALTASNLAIVQICVFISSKSEVSWRLSFSHFGPEWISHCNMVLPCLHFIWCPIQFMCVRMYTCCDYAMPDGRWTGHSGKYDNISIQMDGTFSLSCRWAHRPMCVSIISSFFNVFVSAAFGGILSGNQRFTLHKRWRMQGGSATRATHTHHMIMEAVKTTIMVRRSMNWLQKLS